MALPKNTRQDLKLDVHQLINERKERVRQLLELNGGPSSIDDSMTPLTPNFSDSLFLESPSQGASQNSTAETVLDKPATLEIFDESFVNRFFTEDEINFSFIERTPTILDIPLLSHDDLVEYIQATLKEKICRHSPNTSKICCRFLFFLMSVTTNELVFETCLNILKQQISKAFFCISVQDLLVILLNYGTVKSKLWPDALEITIRSHFKKLPLNSLKEVAQKKNFNFPHQNFEGILSLLRFNITTFPSFSECEKKGLIYMFLNLSMEDIVVKDEFLLPMIKDVIASLLDSYTEEEWRELDFKRVEDLVLDCWNHDLEAPGVVQRTNCFPSTTRGIQLQKAFAFFAFQNLLNIEDEIQLCGQVTLDEVYLKIRKLNKHPISDYLVFHCIMELIFLSFDTSDPSLDKEKLKSIAKIIKEAQHSIREVSAEMDANRIAVKDIMCKIAAWIASSIPNTDNVV